MMRCYSQVPCVLRPVTSPMGTSHVTCHHIHAVHAIRAALRGGIYTICKHVPLSSAVRVASCHVTHMNESRHTSSYTHNSRTSLSHVTTSHTHNSRSHVAATMEYRACCITWRRPCECVTSRINTRQILPWSAVRVESCLTWICHTTRTKKPRCIYQWVISRMNVTVRHRACCIMSRHPCGWVMSHIIIHIRCYYRDRPCRIMSRRPCEWIMSRNPCEWIMSHRTCERVISHI